MNDKNAEFLLMAKTLESLTDQANELREKLKAKMLEMGYGTMLQDPETKLVYQLVKPQGAFVHYKEIDYIRTKKSDEKTGSLSVKKAEEAGFVL